MKFFLNRANSFIKGFIFFCRPHLYLGWLKHPFLFMANTLYLSKWMSKQDRKNILNDFYTIKKDYTKRYTVYQEVIKKMELEDKAVDYLEFGVSEAYSFRWWLENNKHADSKFYGFDTFEGLPENWGLYKSGDMTAGIPEVNDDRASFFKGLFQETLPTFLKQHDLNTGNRKIIHLDADLFTSTLFVLTSIAPYLEKGDILIFDEFNVPNHEFFAFKIFAESYYVKTKLIVAVNNYYQLALEIE